MSICAQILILTFLNPCSECPERRPIRKPAEFNAHSPGGGGKRFGPTGLSLTGADSRSGKVRAPRRLAKDAKVINNKK
jgi:hypothetical protein